MKRLAAITLLIFISFCTANGLSRLKHQTRVRAQAEAEAIGNGGKNLVGEAVGKKSEKIARWEIKSAVQDPGTHKWTYTLVDPAVSFIPPKQVQEDDAEYELKEVPVTEWYTKFFQKVHITTGTQGVSVQHWLASGPKKVGAHLAHMNELVRVTKASAEEFHVAYSGGAADCIIVLMIGTDSANMIHASRDTLAGDIKFPATGGIKAVYLASQVFGKGFDTAWRSGLVRMVFKHLKTKKWLPFVKGVYSSSKLAYNIKTDQVSTEFEASDFKDDPGHEGSPPPPPPSPSSPGHGGGELPPVETPKSSSSPLKKSSPRKLRESK